VILLPNKKRRKGLRKGNPLLYRLFGYKDTR